MSRNNNGPRGTTITAASRKSFSTTKFSTKTKRENQMSNHTSGPRGSNAIEAHLRSLQDPCLCCGTPTNGKLPSWENPHAGLRMPIAICRVCYEHATSSPEGGANVKEKINAQLGLMRFARIADRLGIEFSVYRKALADLFNAGHKFPEINSLMDDKLGLPKGLHARIEEQTYGLGGLE